MHQLNFTETMIFFTVFLWLICFGCSVFFQQHKLFLRWTNQTIKTLFRSNWRYIFCIILGYFLAKENIFHLTIPW